MTRLSQLSPRPGHAHSIPSHRDHRYPAHQFSLGGAVRRLNP